MIRNASRSVLLVGLIASAPWLLGADGSGCGKTSPTPPAMDAGGACTADEGQHCGGNIRNACTCAAGLICQTEAGSQLPPGDVGGTCTKVPTPCTCLGCSCGPSAPDAGSPRAGSPAHAGSPAQAGSSAQAGSPSGTADAGQLDAGGMCVAKRGEHCGGNIKNPCTCATGLICKANAGTNKPAGDVGGVCEPAVEETDAGGCVSDEGGGCGGNIRNPCTCAAGLECKPNPGGPPFGDVGGSCQRSSAQNACTTSADCTLKADYCTGCDCVALGPGESIKPCSGPGVRCFADPCGSKTAKCVSGQCEVN